MTKIEQLQTGPIKNENTKNIMLINRNAIKDPNMQTQWDSERSIPKNTNSPEAMNIEKI